MKGWQSNGSKINGVTIKHSDMSYQMKETVTSELVEICKTGDLTSMKISKLLTERLNMDHPTGWVCLIGKQFTANISH